MNSCSNPRSPVPASLGYQMPPEWYPHESTWLAWPKNPRTWPHHQILQVQEVYLYLIELLSPHERVNLLIDDDETEMHIRERLGAADVSSDQIVFYQIKTADSWIRDYGPNFLIRKVESKIEQAFNHWQFNAWGNKYEDLKNDAHIPRHLETILAMPCFNPPVVLEGGAIEVNGKGVGISTSCCLLNQNRNPSHSKSEMVQYLKDYLGLRKILWLHRGLVGDDTDGHVDNLARFVNSQTIVCSLEEDPTDDNYEALLENYQYLQTFRDEQENPFQIIPLPMPAPIEGAQRRLPASYLNFYIANQLVLLPTFDDKQDASVTDTLQRLFPDRQVVGVDSRNLVWGHGALHCLTLQQPTSIA